MTDKETNLVSRLRSKVSDNPLDAETSQPLLNQQIWTDDELLAELNSARVTVFKGKKSDLSLLTEFEYEIVVLQANINLNYQLAQNSARYVKYTLNNANVQKCSPQEFIQIATALQQSLTNLLDEGSDTSDIGKVVVQDTLRRFSKIDNAIVPTKYDSLPALPPFSVENTPQGVKINIGYTFIPDYRTHYVRKEWGGGKTILYNSSALMADSIIDTSVIDGSTYTYTLYLENINGKSSTKSISIKYEA